MSIQIIRHWEEANNAAISGDKEEVRLLLIAEMERMDEDTFVNQTFNKEDINDRVREAGKSWASEIESAVKELENGNDVNALNHLEKANDIETDFGDNPNTAYLLSAAKWVAA